MSDEAKKEPAPDAATQLFEATTGSFGAVVKGKQIAEADAISRRQAGLDVVVCGPDLATNRRVAGQIETQANGRY